MGTEYIVIKPKDAREKWMICGFLGSETKSDFQVVTDINDYASKESNGTMVEEKAASSTIPFANATDEIPASDNIPSSTTDNNGGMDNVWNNWLSNSERISVENSLQGGNPASNTHQTPTPTNHHSPTPLPSSSQLQELNLPGGSNSQVKVEQQQDWGTDVPYRYRMPKQEYVVITLSDDEDDDAPISAPSSSNKSPIAAPRTSITVPRALINAPSYNQQLTDEQSHLQQLLNARADEDGLSMYDTLKNRRSRSMARNYVDQDDDGPAPKRGRSKSRGRSRSRRSSVSSGGIECKMCRKIMSENYKYYFWAKEHALIHLDHLKRFECMIDGCTYQSGPKPNMKSHMKTRHQGDYQVKEIILTDEQMQQWEDMVQQCFPGAAPMK